MRQGSARIPPSLTRTLGRLVLCSWVFLVPLPAFPQAQVEQQTPPPPSERPVRGLFGGVERDPTRYRSLDLSLSLLGGYDDNLSPEGGGAGSPAGDPRFTTNGGLGNASASLSYRKGRNENWFAAGVRSGFRYYPSITELNGADHGGNVGFSLRPSGRTLLGGRVDGAYEPFFSLAAVPVFSADPSAGPLPGSMDYAFTERPSLSYGSFLNATYDLSRRTHATASHSFRGLDFTGESDDGRLRDQSAHVGMNREVSRRWTVGGRYGYSWGETAYTGEGTQTRSHGADLTVDYRRVLRSRRQLSIGFAPGFSRVETESVLIGRRVDRRVTASVRADIDVARTWNLGGNYRRGLRHLPGVREPVFADDAQVRLAGLVGRRLDVLFSADYTEGEAGTVSSGFTSLSGSSQVRFAINGHTALTAQFIHYRYEFGAEAVLPAGMRRRFDRNAVRVGIDVWLPLYR
jgi:hypothetical protein